jgi:hypothetical protein
MLVSLALVLISGQKFAVRKSSRRAWTIACLVLGVIVCMAAFGLARRAFDPGFRGMVRGVFRAAGKGSFTWRLARYEEHFPRIAQRPIFGWSRPDWSASADHTFVNPIGTALWFHILGRFGLLGLVCSSSVLLWPVVRVSSGCRGIPGARLPVRSCS